MKYFINIRFNFEGFHKYDDAPKEVEYLKLKHRHLFYVEAKIEVFHNDRELEFIMVKNDLQDFIKNEYKDKMVGSCEMIALDLYGYILYKYGVNRLIEVKVYEDNENGGEVSNLYE